MTDPIEINGGIFHHVWRGAVDLANANFCQVYIYIVPAGLNSTWRTTNRENVPDEAIVVITIDPTFVPEKKDG